MSMQQDVTTTRQQEIVLIEKIRTLSPDKVAQVEDFVDFLSQKSRDLRLLQAGKKLAEDAFRRVWDNPEDEEYDRL
ncbi:MAG: toxin-antitoxin system, antitoxin component, Xre family protein [Thermodesulfobacteriota bacterium]|nr:toxin-antitoxin system, antitoxin component, Xre family protein [Thermodesulfobacteriota bacterium]